MTFRFDLSRGGLDARCCTLGALLSSPVTISQVLALMVPNFIYRACLTVPAMAHGKLRHNDTVT
jgi:uncharacterized membrane protein YczE